MFTLDLRVVGTGTRVGGLEPFAQAEAELAEASFDGADDGGQQEVRDRAAFQRAGWRFDLPDAGMAPAGIERGLLAKHPDGGLVVVRDRLVVGFAEGFDPQTILGDFSNVTKLPFGTNAYELHFDLPNDGLHEALAEATANLQSKSGGAVRFVDPVLVYHVESPATEPSATDPLDPQNQWHWKKIMLKEAWAAGKTKGINVHAVKTLVAVIDEGFFEHPTQIKPNVVARAFVGEDGKRMTAALPKRTHGTFCAGLVGAVSDSTMVNGAAPECGLILVALDGTITSTGMGAALKLCVDEGADVISCSLGPSGHGWDRLDTLLEAIDDVQKTGRHSHGTVVVWAVSNQEGVIPANSLESYGPLLCVAPSDAGDARISSAYGDGLDLIAPGNAVTGIYWTSGNSSSATGQTGASFAAPCVAGVAALVISINPELGWEEVIDILTKKSCDPQDPNKTWEEKMGWGRLNALRAVQATPVPPLPP